MMATDTTTRTQVYRTYIRATPEAIWQALTRPESIDRYGYGGRADYDLRRGGAFSRRCRRDRSVSRPTRPTTVVSQPPRFSTAAVSERLSRSHASCTASSASPAEPSIRSATRRRWARRSSKRSASQSSSSIASVPWSRPVTRH